MQTPDHLKRKPAFTVEHFRDSLLAAQVCNQIAGTSRFWISIAPKGAADATSQYLYFNLPMDPNDSFKFDVGALISQGDVIRVKSDTGSVSFTFYNRVTSLLGQDL